MPTATGPLPASLRSPDASGGRVAGLLSSEVESRRLDHPEDTIEPTPRPFADQ